MQRIKLEQKYDYMVKLVIIGDSAVGKTNILLRYVNDQYKLNHITTIGVDFKVKIINIDGINIKMQIWDTAGQQRFKTITQTYYKGAAGVIFVYSITDYKSFQSITNWINQVNQSQPEEMSKILIGNKRDCAQADRKVTFDQGKKLADSFGLQFVQTSAKQNINIEHLFEVISREIKKRLQKSQIEGQNRGNSLKLNHIQKGSIKEQCEC